MTISCTVCYKNCPVLFVVYEKATTVPDFWVKSTSFMPSWKSSWHPHLHSCSSVQRKHWISLQQNQHNSVWECENTIHTTIGPSFREQGSLLHDRCHLFYMLKICFVLFCFSILTKTWNSSHCVPFHPWKVCSEVVWPNYFLLALAILDSIYLALAIFSADIMDNKKVIHL